VNRVKYFTYLGGWQDETLQSDTQRRTGLAVDALHWIHKVVWSPLLASGGSTGAIVPPLDWGKKFHIATKKHTHLQTPFCMPECAKTHLQQSRISKFSGGGSSPGSPSSIGREGTGEGRRGGMGEGGEGRSTWAPPHRDKLWIRPCSQRAK